MDALWDDYSKFIIDVQRKTNKKFLLKDPPVPPGEEDKIDGKFQETTCFWFPFFLSFLGLVYL